VTENEFVRDVVFAVQESFQQSFVAKIDERPSEFTGQIHSPRLLALSRGVLAAHVVVLHQDEAVFWACTQPN
jgi:hypothetical protein